MKLIVAVIRPGQLATVPSALRNCDIRETTVTVASGSGHERGHSLIYRASVLEEPLLPRVRLEVVVSDASEEAAVDAIQRHGQTGDAGDGIICDFPLDRFIRIRTGEQVTSNSEGPAKRRA